VNGPRRLRLDAAIYGGSALIAVGVAVLAGIPIFREWGRLALAPYIVAAAAALGLAREGRRSPRPRAWLVSFLFVGVVLLPLGLQVAWRARTGPGLHVQSEAVVTEEAAKALLDLRNPYEASYIDGPLAARPLGTKTHFPYMPGMLSFGLPRALFGDHPWADARLWFLAGTVIAFSIAVRRWRAPSDRRLEAGQWLFLVPTGALLATTGGDDLPVVGLLLLSLVLVRERRWLGAGIVGGLAAGLKLTSWVVLPFFVLAAGTDRRSRLRMGLAAMTVAATFVAPFVAWGPSAFVEDTLRFPLGVGEQRTPAETPTLGGVLVEAFPSARAPLTVLVVVVGVGLWGWLLVRPPAPDVGAAARRSGLAFLAVIVLAPASRVGYLVYPVNLLAWAWLMDAAHSDRPGRDPVSRPG
jgi:hypothetical protein